MEGFVLDWKIIRSCPKYTEWEQGKEQQGRLKTGFKRHELQTHFPSGIKIAKRVYDSEIIANEKKKILRQIEALRQKQSSRWENDRIADNKYFLSIIFSSLGLAFKKKDNKR